MVPHPRSLGKGFRVHEASKRIPLATVTENP